MKKTIQVGSKLKKVDVAEDITVYIQCCSGLDFNVEVLSNEEKRRYHGFTNAQKAHRFLAAHHLKRHVLAQLTGCQPKEVQVDRAVNNKPIHDEVKFSLSHSGDYAVVAVSKRFELGVDVEKIDEQRLQSLSQGFVHPLDESADLTLLWTQKEAVSKAIGKGMAMDFTLLNVSKRCCQYQGQNIELLALDEIPGFRLSVAFY